TDGSVVVGSSYSTMGRQAFRWTQGGGMAGLGFLSGGSDSLATGVSADGSVVVGTSNDATFASFAFRWTQGSGMVNLGTTPGGAGAAASDVSADGQVVV